MKAQGSLAWCVAVGSCTRTVCLNQTAGLQAVHAVWRHPRNSQMLPSESWRSDRGIHFIPERGPWAYSTEGLSVTLKDPMCKKTVSVR